MTQQTHIAHDQILNPAPEGWAPAPAPLDMPEQVLERPAERVSPFVALRLLLTRQSV